jgi:hypothetical protein
LVFNDPVVVLAPLPGVSAPALTTGALRFCIPHGIAWGTWGDPPATLAGIVEVLVGCDELNDKSGAAPPSCIAAANGTTNSPTRARPTIKRDPTATRERRRLDIGRNPPLWTASVFVRMTGAAAGPVSY